MITNNTIHLTQGPKQLVRRVEAQLPAPRPWLQLAALYRNPIENIMAILGVKSNGDSWQIHIWQIEGYYMILDIFISNIGWYWIFMNIYIYGKSAQIRVKLFVKLSNMEDGYDTCYG